MRERGLGIEELSPREWGMRGKEGSVLSFPDSGHAFARTAEFCTKGSTRTLIRASLCSGNMGYGQPGMPTEKMLPMMTTLLSQPPVTTLHHPHDESLEGVSLEGCQGAVKDLSSRATSKRPAGPVLAPAGTANLGNSCLRDTGVLNMGMVAWAAVSSPGCLGTLPYSACRVLATHLWNKSASRMDVPRCAH